MKLTLNDRFKHVFARDPDHIQPLERLLSGGISGAVAQVGYWVREDRCRLP